MKYTILIIMLSLSIIAHGQPVQGVDFDLAKPQEEVSPEEWANKKGLFVKTEEGTYVWVWNLSTVGYARSAEKVMILLEANNYKTEPDLDRSIISSSRIDLFSDYSEMSQKCRFEEAEILMYWDIHEDWTLMWLVNDEAAIVGLASDVDLQWLGVDRRSKATRLERMGQGAFESHDSDNYDSGEGIVSEGSGYGLEGRGLKSLPLPNISGCEISQKITIIVDIQVDRDGKVVGASVRSANYQDKCIWDTVVEAALKSRFTPSQTAAYRQQGWIRYIISP